MFSSFIFQIIFHKTRDMQPFTMELPKLRIPNIFNVFSNVWNNIKEYITKAGTSILIMSIVIWFLQSFDTSFLMIEDNNYSIFGSFGKFISPLFAPLGFGDWRASVSILTGFSAKEAVVSTLGILYNFNELEISFSRISAYSFMIFSLLYCPCIATMATIKQEMKNIKWVIFIIIYQLIVAYLFSYLIYHIGIFIGVN